ncbi:SIS domain-containing protein [Leucobacter sp. USHLN153]|uniref:SIS domain-containing protein n=1 Tax=Leucobacter sp. USHLN153 TaxID=3081268 RepID=UPI003017DFA6
MSDRIPFHQAIHQQPELLTLAASAIAASLDAAELPRWNAGDTVAVLAMGASSNSGHALVAALAQQGVRGVNLTASEVAAYPTNFEPGDHYLVVSESGRSPEPIEAARGRGAGRRIAITNFPDAAISEVSDYSIGYGGIDDSPVYTSGYLSTLMSYSAIMQAVGLQADLDVSGAPQLVADLLTYHQEHVETLAPIFDGLAAVDIIGRGLGISSATQGALMLREAVRLPATGWETYQFVHGPHEVIDTKNMLITIGDGRELDVVLQMADAGARVLVITGAGDDKVAALAHENVSVVRVQHTAVGLTRVLEETVILQLIVDAVARRQGIPVEGTRYQQDDTKLPIAE